MYFVRKLARRRRRQVLDRLYNRQEYLAWFQYRPEELEPDPDWPRHEQFIHAGWHIVGNPDLQRQSLGYFLCDPPRFVPCPHLYAPQTRIGMKGIEEMCGSIPWEHVFFWAPFRNEED